MATDAAVIDDPNSGSAGEKVYLKGFADTSHPGSLTVEVYLRDGLPEPPSVRFSTPSLRTSSATGGFETAEDASLAGGGLRVVLAEFSDGRGARVPVQIDGEVWGHLPMSFRVEPAALEVIRERPPGDEASRRPGASEWAMIWGRP